MATIQIDGTPDDDVLTNDGTNRSDDISGYAIFGLDGNDILEGSHGDDILNGGVGVLDAVSYFNEIDSVSVDLMAGTATGAGIGNDSLIDIEVVDAGKGDDVLYGDDRYNILRGWEGNDTIISGNGNGDILAGRGSTLYGGKGHDVLDSSNVLDATIGIVMYGNEGADSLTGGKGNDVLFGGFGNDTLDGGAGGLDDIASYRLETASVKVDLVKGISIGKDSGTDTLFNIESVNGTNFKDTLIGNDQNNVLQSFKGRDTLIGGAGDDTLIGGVGNDKIQTGVGNDNIMLDSLTGVDRISDFSVKNDTIQLAQINQEFQSSAFDSLALGELASDMFISGEGLTTANDSNDYLIYNKTTGALYYDADGSGDVNTPVQIAVIGNQAALTSADFIVI